MSAEAAALFAALLELGSLKTLAAFDAAFEPVTSLFDLAIGGLLGLRFDLAPGLRQPDSCGTFSKLSPSWRSFGESQVLTELERRMVQFVGEYLREHDGRGPTLAEIGAACGVASVGTVHRYLASIEKKGYLSKSGVGWRTRAGPTELPFLGVTAAGKPIEAIENAETIDLSAMLLQPDCFIVRVQGDSMIDSGILSGDLVVLRSAQTAKDGQIVLALVGSESTLKELRRVDAGRKVRLVPHNSKHEPQEFKAEDVQVQGILTGVVRTVP